MPHLPAGFVSRTATVKDFRMHYVIGGQGPAVAIVHGGWDSWWAWRDVAPELAKTHTVILPALRGLAKSSKPSDGYDADNLGDDLHALLTDELQLDEYAAVGHDWGAVAAYALAAQYPDAVTRLAIYEMVIPGVGMMEQAIVPQPGGQYLWHMGWQSVPDIPEMLIRNNLREYMQMFFTNYASIPDAVDQASLDHYVSLYSEAGALRAFMMYYQNFWVHGQQVQAHMASKLKMPVLAYGGDACLGELTPQCLRQLAEDVEGGVIPNCGHWIAEESPAFVLETLTRFLDGAGDASQSAQTAAVAQ
jgi:pimeloyl-ACP methyl ester carboxylesterase